MAEAAEIHDPAVAVHFARLEGKMEALTQQQRESARVLEAVASELREVTKLHHRSDTNEAAIKRIWEHMDAQGKAIDARLDRLIAGHEGTRERVQKLVWVSVGASSVVGLLVCLLGWVGNDALSTTRSDVSDLRKNAQLLDRSNDARLDKIEVWLAGDKARPYAR